MNNDIDFKSLWQKQTIVEPDMEALLLKLKKFKKSNLKKMVIQNILLIATCIFIGFIWYYYQPKMITTKIGIVVTILSMIIFLFPYNKQFSAFNKIDGTQTNDEYLQNLIKLKSKQKFLQTKIMSLYFVLLSSGIILYMIEPTSHMSTFWQVFSYTILLAWIAFNWFYIRPKTIKKQQAPLDELIKTFEGMNMQLKGN